MICPLSIMPPVAATDEPAQGAECIQQQCAWWDRTGQGCAPLAMVTAITALAVAIHIGSTRPPIRPSN